MRTRTPSQMTRSVDRGGGSPLAPFRPGQWGATPPPRQQQPLPPALKARPASRELTSQPEPTAGVRGRGCLGTQEPSGLAGGEGLRPWPAPPGSRHCCPVSVRWAGGLRTGMGGATEAGYAHAPTTRADPPPHAHALRAGMRPQPRTSPGPTRPRTVPWPGARGCVCTRARRPAGGAASRQNKHPLPRFLLPRLGPPA